MGKERTTRGPLVAALVCGLVLIAVGAAWLLAGHPDGTVSTDWADAPSEESVQFCSGTDLSEADLRNGKKVGLHERAVNDYKAAFPGSAANFESNSAVANQQREYYLKLIERDSKECDVIFLDVIYMAEFADKGLLYDLTPYLEQHDRKSDFNDQSMKTVSYDDKLWGVPKQLDAGVLYYRKDRATAPSSWQDLFRQARPAGPAALPGLRLQRETNEGLTVVFLELAFAATDGRPIISDDGTTANIAEPGVLEALKFMRNAVEERVIPPTEPGLEGSLDLYERGRASFLRGWPFVAARVKDDAERRGDTRSARRETARETRIVKLPPWRAGGTSFGVLGGHNLVIPRSAGNPEGALHFIDYVTRASQVRKDERLAAQFPVLKAVAEDERSLANRSLAMAIRGTEVLPRPSLPNYAEVSDVIAIGVQRALEGQPDEDSLWRALMRIDERVEDLLP